MTTTLQSRVIIATIALGTGQFGDDAGDTITISDARILCEITKASGDFFGQCECKIFGLSPDKIAKLTTIGPLNTAIRGKNTIQIAAGTSDKLQVVFTGAIDTAVLDGNQAPDAPLQITAFAGLDLVIKPIGHSSYRGTVPTATIMQDLASKAGLSYTDAGISGNLSNVYLTGNIRQQILSVSRQAGIEAIIDSGRLTVYPVYGVKIANDEIIEINAESGLVGYPVASSNGISLTVLFDFRLQVPGKVNITSIMPHVTGQHVLYKVSHSLASLAKDQGPWFSTIDCYPDNI